MDDFENGDDDTAPVNTSEAHSNGSGDGLPGVPVEGYPGIRAGAFATGGGLLGMLVSNKQGRGPGADPDPDESFKFCPPMPARIMRGNQHNIGSTHGGWGPTHPVTGFGTAVDTAQWGGKSALRRYIDQVSGALADGTPLFDGISEVIGGHGETINGRHYDAAHVRDGIKENYPGELLLEIPNQNDLGTKSVVLRIPKALECPKP
jgi:hypothetical protein